MRRVSSRALRALRGRGGFDDLADNGARFGVFFEPWPAFSVTELSTTGRTSDETSLSLVWDENFGSGTLTDKHAGQSFARIIAGTMDLFFLGDAGCIGIDVDVRVSARGNRQGACRRRAAECCW